MPSQIDVEAAYRRSDLLNRRRKLMTAWGTFCGQPLSINVERHPIEDVLSGRHA